MKRIKANQIADGYLSEGVDEGINPEYFPADEAQAEIEKAKIEGYRDGVIEGMKAKQAEIDALSKGILDTWKDYYEGCRHDEFSCTFCDASNHEGFENFEHYDDCIVLVANKHKGE